jgi:hypothetical protein
MEKIPVRKSVLRVRKNICMRLVYQAKSIGRYIRDPDTVERLLGYTARRLKT